MKRVLEDGRLINFIDQGFEDTRPRQQLPPVYLRSGDLYIARRDLIMEQNKLVGTDTRAYIMNPDRSVNIDTQADLLRATYLLKEQRT